MITQDEEKYLETIPEDKVAHIKPFDPKVRDTGNNIVQDIKNKLPNLEILFIGASALGIAGQNDIDLNILSRPGEYSKFLPILVELLGEPTKSSLNLVKWEFTREGFEVEVYLTDKSSPALQRQLKVFNILKNNSTLVKEYERIKLGCRGLLFREYMRRKYEFFNKILDPESIEVRPQ